MTRIFGPSPVLMFPMDPVSGGGGAIKPPLSSVDAFARIETGLNDITAGLAQSSKGQGSVAEALASIKGRVSSLEIELEAARRRAEEEGNRARNIETILSDERRQADAMRTQLDSRSSQIVDLVRERRLMAERAHALAEELRLSRGTLDEHASKVEALLAVIDEAKAGTVEVFSQVDEASNMVSGAYRAIEALHDSLVPLFGAESPAVARVKEQAAAIASAAKSIEELHASKAELAGLLRADGSRSGLMDLRELHRKIPLLDESSFESTKLLSEQILLRLFARHITMFQKNSKEELSRKLNSFLGAASALLARNDIPGATKTTYEMISSFVDLRVPDQDCRGLFYQMIRVANMLNSGRNLDSISTLFPELDFQGWQVDEREIRTRRIRSISEVDAMEGNTLIEFKTVWFGGMFGSYLVSLLKNADKGPASITRDIFDVQNGVNHAGHAAKVANQMIRYRTIMDSGPYDSLELHITSYEPVPDKVLAALYDFFGRERLKVFWYDDVLSSNSRLLAPKDEGETVAAAPEPPASAEEPAAALPPATEQAPVVAAAEATPAPEATDVGDGGADLIATLAVELESPPIVVTAVGEVESSVGPEDEATTSFYESRLSNLLGNDAERVESFVRWMITSGRWTAISLVPKEERRGPLERTVREWIKSHESSGSAQPAAPWAEISASKAQNRFNTLFRDVTRKDIGLDWDQRVTQGVQNTDVLRVLSWIKDNEAVADDRTTGLGEMTGDFMTYLKDTYRPESYFKTDVDGRRLTLIMRRYVWLCG